MYNINFFIHLNVLIRCESCEEGEWRCTDSLCIPSVKRCDGHWNCYDHSDEDNCGKFDVLIITNIRCNNKNLKYQV